MDSKRDKWFFPLHYQMIQDPAFIALSVFERLVLIDCIEQLGRHSYLVSQGRRQGAFARTDDSWAKRLRMCRDAFRNARRELGRLKWLDYSPGYQFPNQLGVATRYHRAEFANTDSGPYVPILRTAWAKLIRALQSKELDQYALVTFALAMYLWRICGGAQHGTALIPKLAIRELGFTLAKFKAGLIALHEFSPELLKYRQLCRAFELSDCTGVWDFKPLIQA